MRHHARIKHHSKEQIGTLTRVLALVIALGCGIGLLYSSTYSLAWIDPLERALLHITGSTTCFIQRSLFRTRTTIASWLHGGDIAAQNKQLFSENAQLQATIAMLEFAAHENKSLRRILPVVPRFQDRSFVIVPVLTSPLLGWNRTFLIGAGSQQGLAVGQPVLAPAGVVGRVARVTRNVAQVTPLTNHTFRLPVRGKASSIEAILAGNGSARPHLIYLQENRPLQEGETLVTSTYEGSFPPGYPVGRLEPGPHGTAHVTPFIDWARLIFVQVITTQLIPNTFQEKHP